MMVSIQLHRTLEDESGLHQHVRHDTFRPLEVARWFRNTLLKHQHWPCAAALKILGTSLLLWSYNGTLSI